METFKRPFVQETCLHCRRSQVLCLGSNPRCDACTSKNIPCDRRLVNPACEQCKLAISVNGDDYKMCGKCFWLSNGSGSSSFPPAVKREETSLPTPVLRTECHNCRTLGLECTAVHKDTMCDRCLLMGMDCDSEALRRKCNNRRIARSKCVGVQDACDRCLRCNAGESCTPIVPEMNIPLAGHTFICRPNAFDPAALQGSTAAHRCCSSCGKHVHSMEIGGWKLLCLKCKEEEREKGTFVFSQPSGNGVPVKDGQLMRTCIGCFQPNLDPGSMASVCETCETLRLTATDTSLNQNIEKWKPEPFPAHGFNGTSYPGGKLWTATNILPSASSNWKFTSCISCQMYGLDCDHVLPACTTCTEREGSVCRYQYKNPIISKQATATCIGCHRIQLKPPGSFINGFCPECETLRPADLGETSNSDNASSLPTTKSAPIPCVMCRGGELKCDRALPVCTPCKERPGIACDYKHIKGPARYGSTSNHCLACGPTTWHTTNTGYCEQCLAVPSSSKSASQSSKIEESKSEIPRFLDFVNTRLEDLRLGRQPPPTPMPSLLPTLTARPILNSPPAATTVCLACLDKVIACALHPKPQRFGIFSSIVAALAIQDRDPSLAIPCLACFDEETICAHHEKPEGIEKVKRALKVAQACGSCRLAGAECDEMRSGCGNCKEKGLECMYIRGGEPPSTEANPDVLPGSEVEEDVPQLPRACGGCRMANVECDEARPGCTVCKEKRLDCMYIAGVTPPYPEPVSVILAPVIEEDENEDFTDESDSRLDESVIFTATADDSQQSLDVGKSQLDESVILAATREEDLDAVDEGESQMDELESEDWDLVSRNEDYEVVEAVKKGDNDSDEDLDGEFKFL